MGGIEELIDVVLMGQHPKLRERCSVYRIVSILEDTFGAYDAAGVRAVLADRRSELDAKLAELGTTSCSYNCRYRTAFELLSFGPDRHAHSHAIITVDTALTKKRVIPKNVALVARL